MVDVIIPSLGKPQLQNAIASLKYLPFEYKLHIIREGKSWPEAINIGLRDTTHDVLLMDDDVELLPDTFGKFQEYKNKADVIGFKLLFPDGTIQHAGGYYHNHQLGHIFWGMDDREIKLKYVCHVTASLMYIKRHTLNAIGGMNEWSDGQQFEDVDFNWRALKAGKRIMCMPQAAYHMESGTKATSDPKFKERKAINYQRLIETHMTDDFALELLKYPREVVL